MKYYHLLLGLVISSSASLHLLAQAAVPDTAFPSPTRLDAYIVSASRTESTIDELPVSATILAPSEIAHTPARSIDQVLYSIPGINLPELPSFAEHPTSNSISMRGLGGIRALVLLDGVPLNQAFSGYIQWNRVPIAAIQSVEILRGGASSLWGNYALGGVINIKTKVPTENGGSLEGGYGTFDTWQLDGSAAYMLNEHASMGVGFGSFETKGYNAVPKNERAPLDRPTSFRTKNVQAGSNFVPAVGLKVYVKTNYHENHQVLGTPKSTNRERDASISAGAQKAFSQGALEVNGWYQYTRFRTDNPDVPSGFSPRFAEYVQNLHVTSAHDAGTSALWSSKFEGSVTQLVVGADYRWISGQDVARIFDETGAQVRTDLGKGRQQFAGLFAEVDIQPKGVPLTLSLSGRYDYWRNYEGFDGNPGGMGPTPDKTKGSFDPRLGLRYRATDMISLRAAAYRAFRAPNLDDLYRAFAIPGGIFEANSQLDPETLVGTEAGVDLGQGNLRTEVTVFRNTVKNLLDSRTLAPSELPPGFFFGGRRINIGEVRSQGLEASVQWRAARSAHVQASYTFTESTVRKNPLDPGIVGNQLADIPKNQATLSLELSLTPPWTLRLQERWVQHRFGDNAATLPVGSHVVTDIYSSYQLNKRVRFFGSVANLFDRKYIAANSGFGPEQLGTPFQVFGGLNVSF